MDYDVLFILIRPCIPTNLLCQLLLMQGRGVIIRLRKMSGCLYTTFPGNSYAFSSGTVAMMKLRPFSILRVSFSYIESSYFWRYGRCHIFSLVFPYILRPFHCYNHTVSPSPYGRGECGKGELNCTRFAHAIRLNSFNLSTNC